MDDSIHLQFGDFEETQKWWDSLSPEEQQKILKENGIE